MRLWWRFLLGLVTIHAVSLTAPAALRTQLAHDLSGEVMREVYGGIPGVTWGRPDRTLTEELEEYAVADLAYAQLHAMEWAAWAPRRAGTLGG